VNDSPDPSHIKRLPRVILSIRHYFPDGGGAEVLARRLAVGLIQRGVPLTVLTGRYGGRPSFEIMDGVPVRRRFIGVYAPVLHEICYLTSFAWELIARRHEYDIVHVFQTHLSAFVAVTIAKRFGKRVVTTAHGAGQGGDMALWRGLLGGKGLLKKVRANVDAATSVSRQVTDELYKAGFAPERTWYIPNGVPIPQSSDRQDRVALRKCLGLPRNAFVGVFVGRLSREKAPGLLLHAWEDILKRYPESRLVFLGEGRQQADLKLYAKRACIEAKIVFAGRVVNVDDYLNASDVFILPSKTEGMSIALLEAMAVGLPVVASRVSGTVDVVEHGENGLLFQSGDREGLIRCLSVLSESTALRADFGKRGRKTVEQRFGLNAMVERYAELYNSVLRGTPKPLNGLNAETGDSMAP
jgi:glycosyltransferase involved in cell wall biosynthesis